MKVPLSVRLKSKVLVTPGWAYRLKLKDGM
jgi:hypothetical protein